MIALNPSLYGNEVLAGIPNTSHRHFRGRNVLPPYEVQWNTNPATLLDSPDWIDMIEASAKTAFAAVKQSIKPALLVWGIMGFVAALYYTIPATQVFFVALSGLQEKLGPLFPFLGMGLAVGVIAESLKVMLSADKTWRKANTFNAFFNLTMFGCLGVIQNYFYMLQVALFGDSGSLQSLVLKVMMDEFVWTAFFANPYQIILCMWKNSGFSIPKVVTQLRPFKAFWGTQVLPVLITNWAFWIPMVAIIYSFPSVLQLPLAILAVTIWVLLLSILTASNDPEKNHE